VKQIARNVTMEGCGALRDCRYLLHDRDTKFTPSDHRVRSGRAARAAWPKPEPECLCGALVRSAKEKCLSKVVLFGERSLRRALSEYVEHFHAEGNHLKGRAMSCCSLGVGTSAATGLFNAASDWAGSCVITISRQRERGGASGEFLARARLPLPERHAVRASSTICVCKLVAIDQPTIRVLNASSTSPGRYAFRWRAPSG
jgi:hypothetical protein